MADFKALRIDLGVGPFHFNRFRIVFQPARDKTKEAYGADFVRNFPKYFNSQYGSVEWSSRTYDGKPVLKFHGISKLFGGDIAKFHHDYVVRLENSTRGFSVQTLQRLFHEWEDAKMAAEGAGGGLLVGGAAGGGIGFVFGGGVGAIPGAAIVGTSAAVTAGVASFQANTLHFLAGRRSWRLDAAAAFGVEGDFLILETAALERFSCPFYFLNDKPQHMEAKVPPLWNSMLRNFVVMNGVNVAPVAPPPRWEQGLLEKTHYWKVNLDSLERVRSDPEFQAAYRLHPNLLA
jgi:hypothetical protein